MTTRGEHPYFDALFEKLHKDEPLFVFRGQDLLAPYAIMVYASLLRAGAAARVETSHQSFALPDLRAEDLRMLAREAEARAAEMLHWQAENPDKTKLPD